MNITEMVSAITRSLVAVVCEGGAEIAIMDALLDHDLLVFTRNQMINYGNIIPRISAKEFQSRYLKVAYEDKLYILRVIDSRAEGFPLKLKEPYNNQVEVINVITAPEIEMLVIVNEGKLREYEKSGKKPSDYCKVDLGHRNVKKPAFIRGYFSDPKKLVKSIQEYHRIHKQKVGELSLSDLLKGSHSGYTY